MSSESLLVGPGSAEWRDALAAAPHDVYHLPEYLEVDAGAEGRPVAFVHREGDDVVLLPLVLNVVDGERLDATSPYGYPGPVGRVDPARATALWSRATRSLVTTLRSAGIVACFVRLNPLLPVPREALGAVGRLVDHSDTVAVDLTLTPEQRWSQTRENHRRQIKRARRQGVETVVDRWEHLPEFVTAYHATMRRVGADGYYFFPKEYFEALRERLGDHLHLVVAVAEGEVLAGGLFFECAGIVQYHLGATRDDALPRQPMKLVLHEAAEWAAARGNRVLHLGGGVGGEEDPLLHFKLGFSPWRRPYATWRVVTDPAAYGALVAARAPGADPGDLAGWFPAYRRPA